MPTLSKDLEHSWWNFRGGLYMVPNYKPGDVCMIRLSVTSKRPGGWVFSVDGRYDEHEGELGGHGGELALTEEDARKYERVTPQVREGIRERWFRDTVRCCEQAGRDVAQIQAQIASLDTDVASFYRRYGVAR